MMPGLLVVSTLPAHAENGGLFGFLASLGGAAPAPAPVEAPTVSEPERPLTVRPLRKKRSPVHAVMARPTKSGPVSIYEDPTLRSGDAVMTKAGMRVFTGGRYAADKPFSEDDFVTVSASKSVAPTLKKTLIELNKLPPHG